MPRAADADRAPEETSDSVTSPTESRNGVDDTLILWFLSLTPLERLQWAEEIADAVLALREAREL